MSFTHPKLNIPFFKSIANQCCIKLEANHLAFSKVGCSTHGVFNSKENSIIGQPRSEHGKSVVKEKNNE